MAFSYFCHGFALDSPKSVTLSFSNSQFSIVHVSLFACALFFGWILSVVRRDNADSRPKLVAGSPEGYAGHVDGKHREARMNHPKGVAVDDRGNIYVADTENMAIRKISDTGIYKEG